MLKLLIQTVVRLLNKTEAKFPESVRCSQVEKMPLFIITKVGMNKYIEKSGWEASFCPNQLDEGENMHCLTVKYLID